jgi:hypothetical protein
MRTGFLRRSIAMEQQRLSELIDQSIALENNVAGLYKLFSQTIPLDAEFWWQLHMEEKSHAALIRAAKDSFAKRGEFPLELIAHSIVDLSAANRKVTALIDHFKENPPSRHEACRIAVELETTAGEAHFTAFMEKEAGNSIEQVFQQLNRGDKDHERRIRAHNDAIQAAG